MRDAKDVVPYDVNDCEVLFRQKTHRTYEQAQKSQKSPLENQRGFFTADLLYVWDNWQTWLQKSFC